MPQFFAISFSFYSPFNPLLNLCMYGVNIIFPLFERIYSYLIKPIISTVCCFATHERDPARFGLFYVSIYNYSHKVNTNINL